MCAPRDDRSGWKLTFRLPLRDARAAQVICRDRASRYAEGTRLGAPDAIQIADRFHLLQNLTKPVDRAVRAHRACLMDRPEAEAVAPGSDKLR